MWQRVKQWAVVGSALVGGAVAQVQAAVPTEVTDAMAAMKVDGIAVATGFLVASIAVSAFLLMRRGAR